MAVPSDGVGNTLRKLEGLMTTKHDQFPLLSLPTELREKIYVYVFAHVFARQYKGPSSRPLAILQTCTKVHDEASSVLFQRTPLRFMIGHLQQVSSIPPPSTVIDRFQNVSFRIVKMNTVMSHHDFARPLESLTGALTQFPVPRRNCYLKCDLVEYADGGVCGRMLQARVKTFTEFETLTLHFEGGVLRGEFPQEAVADDDPDRESKLSTLRLRDGLRRREHKSVHHAVKMFRVLEADLGEGEILDVVDGCEVLHVIRCMFHPSRHATRTEQ